jgi:hypothetical protein
VYLGLETRLAGLNKDGAKELLQLYGATAYMYVYINRFGYDKAARWKQLSE